MQNDEHYFGDVYKIHKIFKRGKGVLIRLGGQ